MALREKALEQVTRADIDDLIATRQRESRTIDYKETVPANDDDQKLKFCANVSAFANAIGGDLVFGVRERRDNGKPTGEPETASGIKGLNFDAEQLRLEQLLRTYVHPRIPAVRFHKVDGDDGPIIVLRVPQSWAAPHLVENKDRWTRCYMRSNGGKQILDVQELRSAFLLSEALPERLRAFRRERAQAIVKHHTPVDMPAKSFLALHIVPLSAFDRPSLVEMDLANYQRLPDMMLLQQGLHVTGDRRYNLDGVLVYNEHRYQSATENGRAYSYVQMYRSGAVEAVAAVHHPNQVGRFAS